MLFGKNWVLKLAVVNKIVRAQRVQFGNQITGVILNGDFIQSYIRYTIIFEIAFWVLLTTANFRTLFFPNSTTDPPITYTN